MVLSVNQNSSNASVFVGDLPAGLYVVDVGANQKQRIIIYR